MCIRDSYIVFNPNQIRSTEAKFDPNEAASDLIYARRDDVVEEEGNAFNLQDERLYHYYKRKLQDTFGRFAQLEKSVAEARNIDGIQAVDSVYVAETLYTGRVDTALMKFENEVVKPIGKALAENNITKEELDLYLYAKHAKERNEYIASINEDMPDGGSGMTNEEADIVLDRVEEEGKTEILEVIAEKVYAITNGTRDILRSKGLAEEELLNAWQETYEFYVPLKGTASDQDQYGGGTGKGFSIKGKESLRAMGRKSKAHSPFAQIVADRTEKIIRAEKNEVGKKFLKEDKIKAEKKRIVLPIPLSIDKTWNVDSETYLILRKYPYYDYRATTNFKLNYRVESMKETINKPIKFIGVGEKIEDFEVFHPERIAQRILGMGDVVSLVEKAQQQFDEKEARLMERKMLKNQFNFTSQRFFTHLDCLT